ncbi:response regulator transcription factor [Sphingomonas sp. PB2P19]|uniref:response regulator transcription factor n=1 Tax=Sphingomonas rhamnosi TaxID=3096156 RepID=UPI002FC6504A
MISNQTSASEPVTPRYRGDPVAAESARIIIVDDDPSLRELLTEFLVDHGLRAEAVDSGAALRARLRQRPCDLIVLDMMMPGEDGLSVLRSLPQTGDAPGVIMFSALAGEVDRVVALELGADDYVTKPSSPREILARIRSVLRRRGGGLGAGEVAAAAPTVPMQVETYAFAGWTLNVRMRVLHAPDGAMVRLTDGEFRLLSAFVSQPQTIHSREAMIEHSGREESTSRGRTIDVNISRLRRKLLDYDRAELIRTVRGNGYVFLPEVVAA